MNGPRSPRVVIIGAGVAGITTAVTLQREGFTDFTILEKGSDVGGVWHWNKYPGLTCDVPSQIYQFGFAPNPRWSQMFAPGPEIQQYMRWVAEKFGLIERIRFSAEVVSSVFDGREWQVRTAGGDEFTADFVIAATGVLHHPFIPEIPGLDEFGDAGGESAGATGRQVVHTARWTPGVETAGRRIAVIGTGSTGVQVISALQPAAESISHFVRTPQWVMWAPMWLGQPGLLNEVFRRVPRLQRGLYDLLLEGSGILADVVTKPSWRRRAVQDYARLSLRAQVPDKKARAQLTPDYQPLCKRQVLSGTYYRALSARNAELVTADIVRVTEDAIVTSDGRAHPVDLIVLATGFAAHNYMRPMDLRGRDGLSIEDAWAKGPRAYRMTAIPGFPNFFTVLGPNSPTGSISLQYTAEMTAKYVAQWLRRFSRGEFETVEVTEEATSRFNDDVVAAMGPTVWNTGCNSWYFTEQGTVDLWPWDRATLTRLLRRPDPQDFHLVRAQAHSVN